MPNGQGTRAVTRSPDERSFLFFASEALGTTGEARFSAFDYPSLAGAGAFLFRPSNRGMCSCCVLLPIAAQSPRAVAAAEACIADLSWLLAEQGFNVAPCGSRRGHEFVRLDAAAARAKLIEAVTAVDRRTVRMLVVSVESAAAALAGEPDLEDPPPAADDALADDDAE